MITRSRGPPACVPGCFGVYGPLGMLGLVAVAAEPRVVARRSLAIIKGPAIDATEKSFDAGAVRRLGRRSATATATR